MKKILLSILAIALTVGTVSASAYALFTDTVSVAGIQITSGSAKLGIYDGGTNTPISGLVGNLNDGLKNLYPGFTDYTTVKFKNESPSNIGLNLKVQLTNINGNWGELYNKVQIAIVPKGDHNNANPPEDGHFADLNYWTSNPIAFGSTINYDSEAEYNIFIKVKKAAGDEISSKWLGGNLTFTATQAE